jgi:putative transposase
MTDEQWAILEPLFPSVPPEKGGRPRKYSLRQIINAIFYIEKTGCQWRMLPKDFPHWGLVWQYFRRWRDDGTWERIRLHLNKKVRVAVGKHPLPTVLIADSQSVKTVLKGGSGDSMAASESKDASGIC